MKPESWIIEDIRRMRQTKDRSAIEDSYLDLLLWYVKVLNEKD